MSGTKELDRIPETARRSGLPAALECLLEGRDRFGPAGYRLRPDGQDGRSSAAGPAVVRRCVVPGGALAAAFAAEQEIAARLGAGASLTKGDRRCLHAGLTRAGAFPAAVVRCCALPDDDRNVMGQRDTVSGSAIFDDVSADPERVMPDPHTIYRYGRLAARVHAAATLDEVTRRPLDAATAARGSIAVAEAKAFGSEVAIEMASDLFSLSGASAADERYDLSRHWRNARTHAGHDPADRKYHHAGNYLLNHVRPSNHGQV